MSKKVEIVICLGSSCFARGNKNTLKLIDNYIKTNNLQDKVFFHGGHCFGKCAEGPVVKVENDIYTNVNENNFVEILSNYLEVNTIKL